MNYSKINNLVGWACGIIATIAYVMTADRFNSWWDTGEFIASAYKLEVVHQPGAPLFLMIQNLFSNLAFGDKTQIAFWMNVGSCVVSGLTIVFLFWTITAVARRLLTKQYNQLRKIHHLQIVGAGVVGSLAYAFTDTFWYSAVESEVYALSSLCTALVVWLMMKWEARADEADANKWLLVIAFVMGLSIGVHLLNLLTIPAIALVVYFRKAKKITSWGVLLSLAIGVLILAFVLWGVIQYSVKIAAYFDLFFVNSLGLGFGTGILFFVILVIATITYGLYYAHRNRKSILQLALLSLSFILFGFTSYSMLLIRSQTNISLNNASPDNAFSFLGYLSREQYASEPLLKGPTYHSKPVGVETKYTYRKDEKSYTKIEGANKYQYDKEMFFPRVYNADKAQIYPYYLGLRAGEEPTMLDNLKFFFTYQLNHMYVRYFMWNFVGRQNDEPSHYSALNGNWISGIPLVDNMRIGDESKASKDASRNTYFFLPLLLGVIGLSYQIQKAKNQALVYGLLFFFTGLAIVIYLNQTPLQPRERDYAYAGSFYIFAVWIGLGVLGSIALLHRLVTNRIATGVSIAIAFIAVPVLLAYQNYDDHDRSDRTWTRDMAYNYLASCEPNAILFTYADNDTFPLWYLQEVEGVRTDVRIVNLSYLQSDWYMKQAMHDVNSAKALPLNIDPNKIKKGIRDVIYLHDMQIEGYTELDTLLEIMLSDNPQNKLQMNNGQYVNVLPTNRLQLSIDKDSVLRNKAVPASWQNDITDAMKWVYNKSYVTKAELGMMAVLAHNNWERPIYFANMLGKENFMGLDRYLVNEGFLYRLMPVEKNQPEGKISLVNTDTLYRNITQIYQFGNISKMKHYDTDYRRFVNNYLFDQNINVALDTLIKENRLEEAKEIALLAVKNKPNYIYGSDMVNTYAVVVDTLLKVKETKLATDLADEYISYIDQRLDYIKDKQAKLSAFDMNEVESTVDSLLRYKMIANTITDKNLIARVSAIEQKYKGVYFE